MVPGQAGAPTWPAGTVGSMTHCTGYRGVCVARTSEIRSLGIDAEPHKPLPDDVLELIASDDERRLLIALQAHLGNCAVDRILFSAKEAVYKAWYPLELQWLGFGDVSVSIAEDGTFEARLADTARRRSPKTPGVFTGRWLATTEHILVATVVR